MNRFALAGSRRNGSGLTLAAITLLVAIPGGLAAQGTGTITGTVTAKKAKELPNIVVYVDGISGDFKPPASHVLMDQKNLSFEPHVLPVIKGTTVDFQNSDDVLHNVFSPDDCVEKMNLGSWAKGEKRSYTFNSVGCRAVMLCKVHPEMEGYVVVIAHPFFAKPDASGKYTIENVPAGKYTVKTWHQKYAEKSAPVEVKAGAAATVDIQM